MTCSLFIPLLLLPRCLPLRLCALSWHFQRINHSDSKVSFLTGNREFRSYQIWVWLLKVIYSHEYYIVVFVIYCPCPRPNFLPVLAIGFSCYCLEQLRTTNRLVPHSSLPFTDHFWIFLPAWSAGLLPRVPLGAFLLGKEWLIPTHFPTF